MPHERFEIAQQAVDLIPQLVYVTTVAIQDALEFCDLRAQAHCEEPQLGEVEPSVEPGGHIMPVMQPRQQRGVPTVRQRPRDQNGVRGGHRQPGVDLRPGRCALARCKSRVVQDRGAFGKLSG